MNAEQLKTHTLVTAGSNYLDIDAYACMVAMAELLQLQGEPAIAYSQAPCNYSVSKSLTKTGQISQTLPVGVSAQHSQYIIVDVSDPEFLKNSVPLERIVKIFDHHVGFEEYWTSRIGRGTHIEFIGAAATLIYREWKRSRLQDKMSHSTARLLISAILDNTLNLTSNNTTAEDIDTFHVLCQRENIGEEWCAQYFSEVQANVEADLKNALLKDIKLNQNTPVLPPKVGQMCVWDANSILAKLPEIRALFSDSSNRWMINIIDIQQGCSYFLCDDDHHQKEIETVFQVQFEAGIAKTQTPYLRKEIIKKALSYMGKLEAEHHD